MPVVVVTVTQTATVVATPTSSGHLSSLSPGTTAGIIIGTLLGAVLLIALVLYLLKRYTRHKFSRVANPHDDAGGTDLRYPPSSSLRRSKRFSRHSQRPSISSEPLMSPVSWPPLPSTPRSPPSSDTPPRLDLISPFTGDSHHSSFDLGEINQVIASGTACPATTLVQQPSSVSSRLGLGNTPPHTRRTSGDGAPSPSTPTKPQQTLFLHRVLKSRAQASERVSLTHRPSLDFSQSRSTTLSSSGVRADEERLLAEAERTALRDAEIAQRGEEEMAEGEVGWEEVESSGSIYSQVSAPIDHSEFFSDPASRHNSSSSLPRGNSSRKQRTPAPSNELPPVAEMPDSQTISRPVSVAASSSLEARVSHRTASPPMFLERSGGTFPLLTSVNFGKDSASSGTLAGSISSTAGLGSSLSGRASRYPSLAASSILSSPSGPHLNTDTEWHHPPSGLAGLTSLQIGPLQNPHSPVEERPHPDVLTPTKRARLREGTTSSIPEVERRDVMQGGIARIDVALHEEDF